MAHLDHQTLPPLRVGQVWQCYSQYQTALITSVGTYNPQGVIDPVAFGVAHSPRHYSGGWTYKPVCKYNTFLGCVMYQIHHAPNSPYGLRVLLYDPAMVQ